MAQSPSSGWWMYHGDPAHTGYVGDSPITSANAAQLKTFKDVQLDGPILSTPAIADGFVYVGVANSHQAVGSNGGAFYKIELATGSIAATFRWDIAPEERDTHGFCGMGCTPAVAGGKVYFVAFNGKLYCLDQETLAAVWITDLRCADPLHNQPVTNTLGMDQGAPPVAGWSSPAASIPASARGRTRSPTASSTAWTRRAATWSGSFAPTSSEPGRPISRTRFPPPW